MNGLSFNQELNSILNDAQFIDFFFEPSNIHIQKCQLLIRRQTCNWYDTKKV